MSVSHVPHYFDLLITSSSWERRCLAIVDNVGTETRFARSVIVKYRHGPIVRGAAEEDHNYAMLYAALKTCSDEVLTIHGELWDPLTVLKTLIEKHNHGEPLRDLRILLDVSTFTKPYVLVLLSYLDAVYRNNRLTLSYTDIVGPHSGQPSVGVKDIVRLPIGGNAFEADRESALMLFIGFEPERLIGLCDTLDPDITVPFYSIRRDAKTPLSNKLINEFFLARPGVKDPRRVDSENPLEIAAAVAKAYSEIRDEYNVSVGVVGSKIQCIGLYLFMKLLRADVSCFYPIPNHYRRMYWNPLLIGESMMLELFRGVRVSTLPPPPTRLHEATVP